MYLSFDPGNISLHQDATALTIYPDDDFAPGDVLRVDVASNGSARRASAQTEDGAFAIGVAVCSCKADQRVAYAGNGDAINFGEAILEPGTAYYLHTAAGKICTLAQLPAGAYMTLVGVAKSTTSMIVCIQPTGARKT